MRATRSGTAVLVCAVVLAGCGSQGNRDPGAQPGGSGIYARIEPLDGDTGVGRAVPVPEVSFAPMSRRVIDRVLDQLPCTRVDGPRETRYPGEGNGWSAECDLGPGDRYARVLSASAMSILSKDAALRTVGSPRLSAVVRSHWSVVCSCSAAELALVKAIR